MTRLSARIAWLAAYHRLIEDPLTYRTGRVRLVASSLRETTHAVASRQGLYAVGPGRVVKLVSGQFFGLTLRDGALYAFQANGLLTSPRARGRIVRLELADQEIRSADVVAQGLPNGCHQIDFIEDRLFVMDTYANRVLCLDSDLRPASAYYPVGKAGFNRWQQGYAHLNSILWHGGEIYLLKHNGTVKTGRPSEVIRCSPTFEVRETIPLAGGACHDIVFLEDGRMLVCDSLGGNLIDRDGLVLEVDDMWTRGLSVGADSLVVGSSYYGAERRKRRYLPGRIFFFDRDLRLDSKLEVPAAPTDICRFDGRDRSLSNVQMAS